MKATILNASTTLVVALLGAGWAYAFYKANWALVAIPAGLGFIGQALFALGKRRVPKTPRFAVRLMECGFLGPFSLSVIGAGAIILIAAKLAPGEKATPEEKGIITAASAAIVAAIATVLVGKSESLWTNWVDTRVSREFKETFAGKFRAQSRPQLASQSLRFEGHEGWGWKARRARAKAIADALQTRADMLPVTVRRG